MKYLKEQLKKLTAKSAHKGELFEKLEQGSIEHVVVTLMHEDILSYDEYKKLRSDFEKRNKNIDIIRITSPRTFGETWAENHVTKVVPRLESTKGTNAKGEYDVFYKKSNKLIKQLKQAFKKQGLPAERLWQYYIEEMNLINTSIDKEIEVRFTFLMPQIQQMSLLTAYITRILLDLEVISIGKLTERFKSEGTSLDYDEFSWLITKKHWETAEKYNNNIRQKKNLGLSDRKSVV